MVKKKQNKQALVPKLRFPEFREVWDKKQMGDFYFFIATNSLSRDKMNDDFGDVRNIHYGDIHTKLPVLLDLECSELPRINQSVSLNKFKEQSFCKDGDVIFADASEDLDDIGKSLEVVNTCGLPILSGLHTIHARQRNARLIIGFAGHLFHSKGIRTQIQRESQGTKVLGVSVARLSRINVYYPKEIAEQHKIADCLGSLDDLIAAHSAKLDALQDHKKGLLQQLFPAEGKTVPALRFSEFKDAGEWKESNLGGIVHFRSGGTPSKTNATYWDGSIPWVSAKDMKTLYLDNTLEHISQTAVDHGANLVVKDTVLMLVRGMTLFKNIPICVLQSPMSYNQDIKALQAKGDLIQGYLPFLLLGIKQRLLEMVDKAGHGTGRINTEELKRLLVKYPCTSEQQHIADCLRSLDALITGQTDKIDALKEHKKGLMQQLFPNPEFSQA